MQSNDRKLGWGILGAARIARKNWKAIRLSGNSMVTAVASRDRDRARGFVEEMQAQSAFPEPPKVSGGYEELIADPEVDAVYIPLPTGLRKEWVIRAAGAGKHVLSEKPCAVNAVDLREMLDACRRNNVQFMDGVMFMHNERLRRVRAVLDDVESIGPIKRITSVFSFLGTGDFRERNIRAQSSLEPLGCLGDLGWYCLRFALWTMNWQLPATVTGRILSAADSGGAAPAVPLEFSGELFFEGGVSCGFYCSFLANHQQWVNISGANGYLKISDFVNTNSDVDVAYETNYRRIAKEGSGLTLCSETTETSQETNQFRHFVDQVRSGVLNESWPDIALRTQQVADACLTSARNGSRTQRVE